jgi:hypothetical protein
MGHTKTRHCGYADAIKLASDVISALHYADVDLLVLKPSIL